jgi:hypothetical protein
MKTLKTNNKKISPNQNHHNPEEITSFIPQILPSLNKTQMISNPSNKDTKSSIKKRKENNGKVSNGD